MRVYKGDMKENKHSTTHKETLNRLSRIAGQVDGIKWMIADKKYCVDIIHQIRAARAALRSVEIKILEKHMHHCVSNAVDSGDTNETTEKVEELLRLMKKMY